MTLSAPGSAAGVPAAGQGRPDPTGPSDPGALSAQLTMELSPADRPRLEASRSCPVCGCVAPISDVFCESCGLQLTNDRQHYSEQPGRRLAAVSDRGLRHAQNEDASATDGDEANGFGILVVCDGVSASSQSELASLVGARAARDELRSARADDRGALSETTLIESVLVETMSRAVRAAHEAVLRQTPDSNASSTFAAAVIDDDLVCWGAIGDSRIYWLPDPGSPDPGSPDPGSPDPGSPETDSPDPNTPAPGPNVIQPVLLNLDDSLAELQIADGLSRDQAERGPHAHAITSWIGHEAPELRPQIGLLRPTGPGWLLVCSDGLWNYASEPADLRAVLDVLALAVRPGALALADALARWACDQGGKDNVTVALARLPLVPTLDGPPVDRPADHGHHGSGERG